MSATAEVATRSDLLFEQLLEQVRIEVDSALDAIAANDDDARRTCTRDLRFEPDSTALDAIGSVAHDSSLSGPRRELPRRLLTLRVLAERELASLFAGSELDPQRLRRGAVVASSALSALKPLQQEFQAASSTSAPDERKYLAMCEVALAVPREDLCAALLLVPRLEAFSLAEDDQAVRATAPTLAVGEARRIAAFVDGRDGARGEAHRACFDALALRSLMEEHLAHIEDLLERAQLAEQGIDAGDSAHETDETDDTDDTDDTVTSDTGVLDELESLLGRIDADRVAYQFVARRLQKQKDMALVAGLKSLVEELGHVSKGLFSSYRQVVARSRDAAALNDTGRDGEAVEAEELFRLSAAAEIEAEQRKGESSDEAVLRALKQLRDGDTEFSVRGATRKLRKTARNRARPLMGIAAVLLGISLWINVDMTPSAKIQQLSYSDFASGLNVSEFDATSTMMMVQVNGWHLLDTIQRRTRAESLAAIAASKGFTSLFVTEEHGWPAATWSPEKGTRLTATQPGL